MTEEQWNRKANKLSARARRIYKATLNEKFPKDWSFVWYFLGATDNICKNVLLVGGLEDKEDLNTLCHELLHVRFPKKRHGKGFEKMVKAMVRVAQGVK